MGNRTNDLIKLANKIERKILIEKLAKDESPSRQATESLLTLLQILPVPVISAPASIAAAAYYMSNGDMFNVFFSILSAIPGLNEVCPILSKMLLKYPGGISKIINYVGRAVERVHLFNEKFIFLTEWYESLSKNRGTFVKIFLGAARTVYSTIAKDAEAKTLELTIGKAFSELMDVMKKLHTDYVLPFAQAAGMNVSEPPIAELEAEFNLQIKALSQPKNGG